MSGSWSCEMYGSRFLIYDQNHACIATVSLGAKEEAELITASPDILRALEELCGEISNIAKELDENSRSKILSSPALRKSLDAIKIAKGEEIPDWLF